MSNHDYYDIALHNAHYHFLRLRGYYVAAKATYIRLLLGQNWGFSALAP